MAYSRQETDLQKIRQRINEAQERKVNVYYMTVGGNKERCPFLEYLHMWFSVGSGITIKTIEREFLFAASMNLLNGDTTKLMIPTEQNVIDKHFKKVLSQLGSGPCLAVISCRCDSHSHIFHRLICAL